MKKLLLISGIFLTLNAYSQTGLKPGDPLIGDWEIVVEENDGDLDGDGEISKEEFEKMESEESIGVPDFHNNSVGIGIMSFMQGNTAMFAGFRVDEGFACPVYPEFSIKGNVITAKSSGPCAVEKTETTFKFTYKVEKDVLTITYKNVEYKYKKFEIGKE